MKKSMFFLGVILLNLGLSGCAGIIQDAVVSSYPTYQETAANWPTLKKNHGRIIIYVTRQDVKFYMTGFEINIDNKMEAIILDRSFVFADLIAENHSIVTKTGYYKPKMIQVKLQAGRTIYVKADINNKNNPLSVMERGDALKDIENMHHIFKEPLPLNAQK